MTASSALAFVRRHGVALESARGQLPNLAETVAGQPIRGSWWAHPKGHEIFGLTRAVRASRDVLVCRLVRGKVTYVHRRCWPALVRLARWFPRDDLSALHEVHTSRGQHELRVVPFPRWVLPKTRREARLLTEAKAAAVLGTWCQRARPPHFAAVCAIAAELPGVEESTSYGTPALKVKGKLFARLQEDGETLVLRTTPIDRELLLKSWPKEFFLTDHYLNYPWVLVRLAVVNRSRLTELIEDAWRRVAPARLRQQRDAIP